jgi:hypothetical protein
MLGHFVVFHAPMDAGCTFGHQQKVDLDRSLPTAGRRFWSVSLLCGSIKTDEGEKAADDDGEGEIAQFWRASQILAQRKIRLQDKREQR